MLNPFREQFEKILGSEECDKIEQKNKERIEALHSTGPMSQRIKHFQEVMHKMEHDLIYPPEEEKVQKNAT